MTSVTNEGEIVRKSSADADLAFFGVGPPEEEVKDSEGSDRDPRHAGSEEARVSMELDLAEPEGEMEARVSMGLTDVSNDDFDVENGEEERIRISLELASGEAGMKSEGPRVSRGVAWETTASSKMVEDGISVTNAGENRVTVEGDGDSEAKAGKEGSAFGSAGSEQLAIKARFSDGGMQSLIESREDHEQRVSNSDSPRLESPGATGSWMDGFETGEMVWGKVKSHPWWPGHIFNEAFASHSVRRTKREGHFLVAFFGDSSFGWFDPSELIPFDPHFAEKSRQTNSRNFMKAVEEAVDEASRRQGLGLSCYCRNRFNFRPTAVSDYFAVDVEDYEPGGVYSKKQIEKARDSFVPVEALSFVKRLALMPKNIECWNIDWIKNKATHLALRKAMFEEFDETYAEAFGMQPVRPSRDAQGMLDRPDNIPSRAAPLSGPLVIAEALGERKGSTKSVTGKSPKDPSKKNKYLLKRRDPKQLPGSTGPKQPPGTDPKASHSSSSSTSARPSPGSAAAKPKPTSPPPDVHHVAQGHGNVHYFNLAQGRQPNIHYFPQDQVPNVHYISQGPADFIIPSLPVLKEAAVGNYVLQKRAPPNAERQQEDGKGFTPETRAPTQTQVSGKMNFDVGVCEPFQGSDDGKLKTETSMDGVRHTNTTTEMSKASVISESPGFVDGIDKNFQKEGMYAVVSKDGPGVKIPVTFDDIEPKPRLLTPDGDLAEEGYRGRSFTGMVDANEPSSMDVEMLPGKFPDMASGGMVKKEKVHKRPRADLSSDGEKKIKKKKKKREPGLDAGMDQPPQKHPKIAKDVDSHRRKLAEKSIGIGFAHAGSPPPAELWGKDDRVNKTDSSAIQLPKLDLGSLNLELPQLVSDLSALALDPFYGIDRHAPAIIHHAFLKFRSLVYQKSLILPPASEPDMSEPHVTQSSVAGSFQEPGRGNAEIALEGEQGEPTSSTKTLKHPLKKDDPTKGGRKRVPSDRLEELSAKRVKKLSQLKMLSTEKKVGFPDGQLRGEQKDTATTGVPAKPVKVDSIKKPEPPPPKLANPTYLVMKFPPRTTLPTMASLKARFARFGPLDISGTRVYWKSLTCKVLFKYKSDARVAYNFVQNNDIFGQVKVNYSLRELDVAGPPESVKRRPEAHSDDGLQFRPSNGSYPSNEARSSIIKHQGQQSVQLKSCLKRPLGDETDTVRGSAVKESPRVKFLLGGDDSREEPSAVVGSSNNGGNGVDVTSSFHAPLDVSSKSSQSVSFLPPPPPLPFPLISDVRESHNFAHFSKVQAYRGDMDGNGTNVDISHQMLNLLLRCSDIVTSVNSTLGYVPYHPL